MPADVGYDKKRSENHDIYWRESQLPSAVADVSDTSNVIRGVPDTGRELSAGDPCPDCGQPLHSPKSLASGLCARCRPKAGAA